MLKRSENTRFAELSSQKVSPGGDTQRHPTTLSRDSKDIEDTLRRGNKDLLEEYATKDSQSWTEEPTMVSEKTPSTAEANQQERNQTFL